MKAQEWVLDQASKEHFVERAERLLGRFGQRRHRVVLNRERGGDDRAAGEQLFAGHHLPEHHRRGPNVGAPIFAFRPEAFGRHVRRLAFEVADLRLRRLAVFDERDAEVEDLHLAVEGQDQIVRADVTVNDVERASLDVFEIVRRVQAAKRLCDQSNADPRRELAAFSKQLGKGDAGDVLHRQIQHAVFFAEVVDLRDRGVVEPRDESGLVEKHGAHVRFEREIFADRFDRDELFEAVNALAARQEDVAHPPGAEPREDLDPRQLGKNLWNPHVPPDQHTEAHRFATKNARGGSGTPHGGDERSQGAPDRRWGGVGSGAQKYQLRLSAPPASVEN